MSALPTGVWLAMAEHFLDTETRDQLPRTALVCLLAGLDVAQVRALWRQDVAPVVGINRCSVAGAWSGWDGDWLIERINQRRTGERHWLGRLRNRWSARLVPANTAELDVLCAFQVALHDCVDHAERERMVADLVWLARCFLGLGVDRAGPVDRVRRGRLYDAVFLPAMQAALVGTEGVTGRQRVRAALADPAPDAGA